MLGLLHAQGVNLLKQMRVFAFKGMSYPVLNSGLPTIDGLKILTALYKKNQVLRFTGKDCS